MSNAGVAHDTPLADLPAGEAVELVNVKVPAPQSRLPRRIAYTGALAYLVAMSWTPSAQSPELAER